MLYDFVCMFSSLIFLKLTVSSRCDIVSSILMDHCSTSSLMICYGLPFRSYQLPWGTVKCGRDASSRCLACVTGDRGWRSRGQTVHRALPFFILECLLVPWGGGTCGMQTRLVLFRELCSHLESFYNLIVSYCQKNSRLEVRSPDSCPSSW